MRTPQPPPISCTVIPSTPFNPYPAQILHWIHPRENLITPSCVSIHALSFSAPMQFLGRLVPKPLPAASPREGGHAGIFPRVVLGPPAPTPPIPDPGASPPPPHLACRASLALALHPTIAGCANPARLRPISPHTARGAPWRPTPRQAPPVRSRALRPGRTPAEPPPPQPIARSGGWRRAPGRGRPSWGVPHQSVGLAEATTRL